MNATLDPLTPQQARCACPQCGLEWEAEVPVALVESLENQGKVVVWCNACLDKPIQRPRPPEPVSVDLWASLCPAEYRLTTEGGQTDRDQLKRAKGQKPDLTHVNAKQIAELVHHPGPVILAGEPGTLKTRIAWRMVRMIWDLKGTVRCFSAWQFQASLQDASSEFRSGKWMEDLTAAGLVFLDDLGKAEWTANTHGAFFELVEARIAHRKPMLVTTNERFESMQESRESHRAPVAQSVAAALVRRFREYAQRVVMTKP